MVLKVVIENDEGWFVAHVPALPGCVSQGRTREEALANVREAIEGWLLVEEEKHRLEDGTDVAAVAVYHCLECRKFRVARQDVPSSERVGPSHVSMAATCFSPRKVFMLTCQFRITKSSHLEH